MTALDTLIYGKIYLVKIKENDDFNSEDFLWVIVNVGSDKVDCEDFQNIVKMSNKGLFTPLISTTTSTWEQIKNAVEIKAQRLNGQPITLFDRVYTFREVLQYSYDVGILTDPKGKDMLNIKTQNRHSRAKQARTSYKWDDGSNMTGTSRTSSTHA